MTTGTLSLDQAFHRQERVSGGRLYTWLIGFYTFLLIALPTGNVFGLNVKMLAFVPLLYLTLTHAIRQKVNPYWGMSWLFGVPLFFSYWLFLGQREQYDFSLALLQYRNLLITLASCWFVSVYISEDKSRLIFFAKLVLWSVAAMSVLKMLIVVYCVARGIPVSTVINGIGDSFGIKLMSFELNEADPGAIGSRIMFTSDLLLAPCCFAAIATRRLLGFGRLTMMCLLLLYLISMVFSFSRFHWAYCGGAILLGFLVAKGEKVMMSVLLSGALASAIFVPAISGILALRFASNLVNDSDAPRHIQIAALSTFFWNAPFQGHGWGTFPRNCIRSELLPYTYEVELLAVAGQVGLIGILAMLLLAAWYFSPLLKWGRGGVAFRVAVLCLFGTFLLGGLTNPMLLSSISSVSYGLLRVLGELGPCAGTEQV